MENSFVGSKIIFVNNSKKAAQNAAAFPFLL